MIGYETQARATRQKIVRLRDLRLPREAKARFDGCSLNFARVRAYDLKLCYLRRRCAWPSKCKDNTQRIHANVCRRCGLIGKVRFPPLHALFL